MWPFKKRPIPAPVTEDGVTARFSPNTGEWEFSIDDVDFTFDSPTFDTAAIQWAKSGLPIIAALMPQMIAAAKDEVRDDVENLINVESVELLSVDLTEFPMEGYFGVNFAGDDSWGDLGVVVTIKDGAIFAVDAGD
jgi:hypothetical protein